MQTFYDIHIQTVFAATEDLPRHSEASVLELKDGSLLMAWQRHEKSKFGSGDQAPSTVSLVSSKDGGLTWTGERVAAGMKDGCVNVYSPSLYRCRDGRITLFFKRYMQLEQGKPQLSTVYRIDSVDEGATWGEEQVLWDRKIYAHMNHGFKRLRSGVTVAPITHSEGMVWTPGGYQTVSVLRSEDDFATWTESNVLQVPMRGLMEPCIAEGADGRLSMVFRTQLGSVFYSESFDEGRTWSKAQTTGLHAPESCPCVVEVPGTDALLVIWNNSEYDMHWRSHYGKRTPLTMALSRDGLRNFTDVFDLETDPDRIFTNPSVTVLSDGRFLMNYWSAEYQADGSFGSLIDLKLATFRIKA